MAGGVRRVGSQNSRSLLRMRSNDRPSGGGGAFLGSRVSEME